MWKDARLLEGVSDKNWDAIKKLNLCAKIKSGLGNDAIRFQVDGKIYRLSHGRIMLDLIETNHNIGYATQLFTRILEIWVDDDIGNKLFPLLFGSNN